MQVISHPSLNILILIYCKIETILKLALVCKPFRASILLNSQLWKKLAWRDYNKIPLECLIYPVRSYIYCMPPYCTYKSIKSANSCHNKKLILGTALCKRHFEYMNSRHFEPLKYCSYKKRDGNHCRGLTKELSSRCPKHTGK